MFFFRIKVWLNVVICFDRMMNIWYPKRFRFLRYRHFQLTISLTVIICTYLFDIGEFFLSKLVMVPQLLLVNSTLNKTTYSGVCKWVPDSIIYTASYLTFATAVPFLLMICCNVNTILIIAKSRSQLRISSAVNKSVNRLTASLVTAKFDCIISFIFVQNFVFNIYIDFFKLFVKSKGKTTNKSDSGNDQQSRYKILHHCNYDGFDVSTAELAYECTIRIHLYFIIRFHISVHFHRRTVPFKFFAHFLYSFFVQLDIS